MKSLNLGCGNAKIAGADNVDINPDCKADLTFDFKQTFPLADQIYDEVYLFHVIEHIEKKFHHTLFGEIRRVLKDDGTLYVSYPEFSRIVQNWLINRNTDRQYWEATIYGRQSWPSDYHVCAMDTLDFKQFLYERGLNVISFLPEPIDQFNTICKIVKSEAPIMYEEVVFNEIFKEKVPK
jgi:predicted SAM-dependent methyltransferase